MGGWRRRSSADAGSAEARSLAYEDDEGRVDTVTSADVNDHLKEITEEAFTAKYFRT